MPLCQQLHVMSICMHYMEERAARLQQPQAVAVGYGAHAVLFEAGVCFMLRFCQMHAEKAACLLCQSIAFLSSSGLVV